MHSFKRWPLLLTIFVCGLIVIFGCSEKPTQPGKTPSTIQITAPKSSVPSGCTLQLSAVVSLVDGTTRNVTSEVSWSNLPGHAGTVQTEGLFVATNNATGIETVRADYQGQTMTIQIEVTRRAMSLAFWPVTANVESGGEVQFKAVAEFQDRSQSYVTEKVSWSVTPGTAAMIDSNGLFQSKSGVAGEEVVTGQFQTLTEQSIVRVQETLDNLFEMVTIPAGSFIMGDDSSQWASEKPAHEVYIDGFEVGKYEVTNEQYVAYLNAAVDAAEIMVVSGLVTGRKGPFAWFVYVRLLGTPSFPEKFIEYTEMEEGIFRFRVIPGVENYPVVRLTWFGAAAFCAHYGLRLPTEAEWEKACRGGQQLEYGTQDGSISKDLANYWDVGGTDCSFAPVGSFPSNPNGLYDMSGNAAEYVFDQYDVNYYANSPVQNPTGPGPTLFMEISPFGSAVWRGGSALISSRFSRSAFRGYIDLQANTSLTNCAFVGFRVARSLD